VVECDEDADGNAIRAELGARTGRSRIRTRIEGETFINTKFLDLALLYLETRNLKPET
jgi:hypothetical protein